MSDRIITTDIIDPDTRCRLVVYIDEKVTWAYPVTDCCGASAKGSEWGTVCRSCYQDIDPAIGAVTYNLRGDDRGMLSEDDFNALKEIAKQGAEPVQI